MIFHNQNWNEFNFLLRCLFAVSGDYYICLLLNFCEFFSRITAKHLFPFKKQFAPKLCLIKTCRKSFSFRFCFLLSQQKKEEKKSSGGKQIDGNVRKKISSFYEKTFERFCSEHWRRWNINLLTSGRLEVYSRKDKVEEDCLNVLCCERFLAFQNNFVSLFRDKFKSFGFQTCSLWNILNSFIKFCEHLGSNFSSKAQVAINNNCVTFQRCCFKLFTNFPEHSNEKLQNFSFFFIFFMQKLPCCFKTLLKQCEQTQNHIPTSRYAFTCFSRLSLQKPPRNELPMS